LLLAPHQLDPQRPQLLHGDDQTARRAHLRDLFDRHERHQRALADPAVLLVVHDPEQVVVAIQLDHVPRELRRLVDLRRARRNPLARQRAHELANLALLLAQGVESAHAFDSRADKPSMVIPLRILTLVIAATGLACAAMTLILLNAR
jgi:hypothetical protein